MRAAILTLVLLTACGEQSVPPQASETHANPAEQREQRAAQPAASQPRPFSVEKESDLYSYKYSWPSEAAAVPQLVKRFTEERELINSDLIAAAKFDRDERRKQGFDFHPYEYQSAYETVGQSDRLLSLSSSTYSFTGGAHGSSESGAILWDRAAAREVKIPDLLQSGQSWTGAIRQPFCMLLDRERAKRRGEPVRPDDMFGECPKYDELTVLLVDEDKNGRFDHVQVTADQYVAGPYAEGAYEISLPITEAMLKRLKAEYRTSFEPRPPVK